MWAKIRKPKDGEVVRDYQHVEVITTLKYEGAREELLLESIEPKSPREAAWQVVKL